ncbi:3-deoxy-D-manno-octulosonic acid transferase [Ponticoccus sp. (in: a-proteobacteria)]|uniref:3-deoxy-D-manno-octulosonic acid transferase n=1 Tax=Ponticoccus sp. (in: a-proteobacteria) TaxID=1925025 RepID=UPI003AB56C0C
MGAAVLLYRLLASLFALITLFRAARAGGRAAACARLRVADPAPGPHVWLHGASNGELASARPVLAALVAARPDLHWLITANTATGLALAQGWALPRTSVRPAPLDLAATTRRTCRDWTIRAHVTLESELWPNRILLCPGPVIGLGTRLSAGSAGIWGRFPRLARRLLTRLDLVVPQDPGTARRLLALGLSQEVLGPTVDLKAFYTAPPPAEAPTFDRARTWLAASTHEGEEAAVLDAHAALLAQDPGLRLILAPRHPARADAIAALVDARGLTLARRSLGQDPQGAQVYLADTMGEMALWYASAGRVFIGGTLTDRGGHTPYEPAAFGAALLHGPDMRNFTTAAERLARAGASVTVTDGVALADALRALSAPEAQARAGEAAQKALRPQADASTLCDLLADHLPRA